MACNVTLTGIGFDCSTNLSGVKTIYIADYDAVTSITASNGKITAINASTGTFKKYIPAKYTGSLTKTLTKNESTGVKYYTNEVTANFNHMDISKRNEMTQLDGGQLAAMVEDYNGVIWYLGKDYAVSASAVVGQTGAGVDDGNFYTLTLTDTSAELPYVVDASIDSLIA